MAGPSLFDFLGAINNTKENLLMTDDPEVLKAFDAFMMRRGLSQSKDTLVVAQEMNRLHAISDWMQWNYMFYSVPAKKRYSPWTKKSKVDEDIKMLSDYFYINMEKASEYLKFLPKESVDEIREKVKKSNGNEKAKPRKAK